MNFLDNLIEQWRPTLHDVGGRVDHFGAQVLDKLDGIKKAVETDTTRRAQFRRWPQSALSPAGGQVDLTYEVPLGKCVRLVSITGSGVAAGAGVAAAVYAGDADNEANLLFVPTYASRFSAAFPEGMYVGPGEKIIVRYFTQGAAQRVTANLNVALLPAAQPLQSRTSGDHEPPGLHGQEVEEMERHFPEVAVVHG